MPELPEVETIRAVLEKTIVGDKIKQVDYHIKRIFRGQSPKKIKQHLLGKKISALHRRGKFLILNLNQGLLLIHLGMSGQLILGQKDGHITNFRPDQHTHFILWFNNSKKLYYRDPRMFGRINYFASQDELGHLFRQWGPEPLSADFNEQYLFGAFRNRKASIKSLLLNQKICPGMGNIYTDEALFKAGIYPGQPASQLTRQDCHRLVSAIKTVLRAGIKAKGTSISDFHDPYQEKGRFQLRLKVYGKDGDACTRCGQPIIKTVIAQRGTHWCQNCQSKKEAQ